MYDPSINPSAEELAFCEAELQEWDRLTVRDYWDAVVAEELGAPQSPASPFAWSEMGPAERARLRRYERRAENTVLRLITTAADASSSSAPNSGEVAA
ncbi:hypothetical protein [Saccharopolyspora shandongensis]|uniref:hypothetical protein n=1 Tax=Saccharopolyspora shandongensis TaxID=418495 RepID=UPI0034070A47